jgi:hypothetical protein
MAFPPKKHVVLPLSEERRRFQRVKVNLLGRYMLSDRREFPCHVANMSPTCRQAAWPSSQRFADKYPSA